MAEGNAYTNILKMMKKQGFNKDVNILIGGVTKLSPLTIDLGSYTIDPEDYIMTQTMQNFIDNKNPDGTPLAVNDAVIVLMDGSNFYLLDKVVG